MKPLSVVIVVDECPDVKAQTFEVTVLVAVDFLRFQSFQEALTPCVVVWIANPAHAAHNTILVQQVRVLRRRVLHASVGMMHEAWLKLASTDCLLQGIYRDRAAQASVLCPPDYAA